MHHILAAILVALGLTVAIIPILLLSMHEPGWRRRPAGSSLVAARVDLDPLWRDWVPDDDGADPARRTGPTDRVVNAAGPLAG